MEHQLGLLVNVLSKLLASSVLLFLILFVSEGNCDVQICNNLLSNDTRQSVLQKLNSYSAQIASLPDLQPGSTPVILLQPPGTCVKGTVVIFHGYADNAEKSRLQARYLFNHGFNVYAVNLAGFDQTSEHWMSFKLRRPKTYQAAKKALLNDKRIAQAIRLISSNMGSNSSFVTNTLGYLIMPIVREILSRPGQSFEDASKLVSMFVPPSNFQDPKHLEKINEYLQSEHAQYEWEALARISEVQALPGPLYTIGYSFGGLNSLNAIATSAAVKRAVMLAPFFPPNNDDPLTFQWVASLLGIIDFFLIGLMPVPASTIVAAYFPAVSAIRDVQTNRARITTETLCVFAKDDIVINLDKSLEICRSKLGAKLFEYPAELGLGHFITPEAGNEYSDAMMKQIVQFFLTGNVDEEEFLNKNVKV